MTKDIQTERRWLRSVIAASAEPLPSFPWMRGHRSRPASLTAGQENNREIAALAPTAQVPLFGRSGAIAAR
ncbi:hypothetical protein [Pseudogemmobacter sonorensis]|uniref:hypothetical protein n=1 Tax=Pseudogemmobacter sonorensis TaxID=2989681 RepID=UPI0036C7C32D